MEQVSEFVKIEHLNTYRILSCDGFTTIVWKKVFLPTEIASTIGELSKSNPGVYFFVAEDVSVYEFDVQIA